MLDLIGKLKHNIIMNKLAITDRVAILQAITEGCSLRSTSRMVGVSINTVTKLLVDAGRACAKFQHEAMRNLSCKRLQLDEIWSFVHTKQRNITEEQYKRSWNRKYLDVGRNRRRN